PKRKALQRSGDGVPGCAAPPNRQRLRLREGSELAEKLGDGPSGAAGGISDRGCHREYRAADFPARHRAPCETIWTSAWHLPPTRKSAQSAQPQETRKLSGLLLLLPLLFRFA